MGVQAAEIPRITQVIVRGANAHVVHASDVTPRAASAHDLAHYQCDSVARLVQEEPVQQLLTHAKHQQSHIEHLESHVIHLSKEVHTLRVSNTLLLASQKEMHSKLSLILSQLGIHDS